MKRRADPPVVGRVVTVEPLACKPNADDLTIIGNRVGRERRRPTGEPPYVVASSSNIAPPRHGYVPSSSHNPARSGFSKTSRASGIEILDLTNAMVVETLLPQGSCPTKRPGLLSCERFECTEHADQVPIAGLANHVKVIWHQTPKMRYDLVALAIPPDLVDHHLGEIVPCENRFTVGGHDSD